MFEVPVIGIDGLATEITPSLIPFVDGATANPLDLIPTDSRTPAGTRFSSQLSVTTVSIASIANSRFRTLILSVRPVIGARSNDDRFPVSLITPLSASHDSILVRCLPPTYAFINSFFVVQVIR
jgi:hypothetical protein